MSYEEFMFKKFEAKQAHQHFIQNKITQRVSGLHGCSGTQEQYSESTTVRTDSKTISKNGAGKKGFIGFNFVMELDE